MRTINFYQARDQMHREFLAGSEMPGPTRAVFRYLLEFTLYGGEAYGWVRHDACGIATIARSTGFCERTVRTALAMLENNGLIKRVTRTKGTGGRLSDEVRIDWPYLYVGAEAAGDAASGSAAGDAASGVAEAAGDAASTTSIRKRTTSNPGTAGDGGGRVIELRRKHG